MSGFVQDLRYAFRTLGKSPVFTSVAVLCLGLGIATNTTIFSCFKAVLLNPFPFESPERLVVLWDRDPRNGTRSANSSISYLNYLDWQAQARRLADVGAYSGRSVAITEGDEPERLSGQAISHNLFPLLGVRPQLGRLFREDEDRPGAAGVVLLSDAVWHRRYHADSSVVGRVISIDNLPYTVTGVMPDRFKFPEASEIWMPIAPLLGKTPRTARAVRMIARLKPGTTVAQLDGEVAAISRRVNVQYGLPTESFVGAAADLRKDFIPDDVSLVTATMMGAVTFVLLIACANVANLMLTRAAGRSREIAIRTAIGAGRGRIVRQLMTEAVLLALMGGLVAVPLTWWGLHLIDLAIPAENPLPYYIRWSLDVPTLAYTAGVSVLTGLLFGLAPALQASRGSLHDALKDGARGVGGSAGKSRVRNALVVAEVALSLVLLVGASLFVRSFMALQHAQIGYDTTPILTMRLYLPGPRYDSTLAKAQGVNEILARVAALPGVEAATISNLLPFDGGGAADGVVIEGTAVDPGKEPALRWTGVGGEWFRTVGVALVTGRDFTTAEVRDSAAVAVINQPMATKFWPAGDPIGRRFRLASDRGHTWIQVIGVSPDIRTAQGGREAPDPWAYLPYRFLPVRNHALMVRVKGPPSALTAGVRGAIRAVDPAIPVFKVNTLERVRQLNFWQFGLFGMMFGVFGAIALFLAAIGVYGVISYGVSQRTRELGVRVALGAQQGDVIGLVVKQGMALAGIGIGVGLLGAFGVTRVVSSLLNGVSPTDPVSFGGVTLFLAAVALVASVIPARRASGVDPIVALRAE